jgi:cytochrome P450
MTTDVHFQRQQRRLLQPAFHKRRVEAYSDTIVHLTEQMLAQWQTGSEVDMPHEMQQLTLRIIMKALFNLDSPTQSASLGQAFTIVMTNSTLFLVFPLIENTEIFCNNRIDGTFFIQPAWNKKTCTSGINKRRCAFGTTDEADSSGKGIDSRGII